MAMTGVLRPGHAQIRVLDMPFAVSSVIQVPTACRALVFVGPMAEVIAKWFRLAGAVGKAN